MATTRWMEQYVTSTGIEMNENVNCYHENVAYIGRGTPAYVRGITPATIPFNITSTNCNLRLTLSDGSNTDSKTLVLASGTNLDARIIAWDITQKLHREAPSNIPLWTTAYCIWNENGFEIRNGSAGNNSSIEVVSTSNDAGPTLGLVPGSGIEMAGSHSYRMYGGIVGAQGHTTNTCTGTISLTGSCSLGGADEYEICAVENIAGPGGGAVITSHGVGTFPGTVTLGGIYNASDNTTYTVSVTASGNAYMTGTLAGSPQMIWTAVPAGANGETVLTSSGVYLLYPNYPYQLGTKGLWIKFSNHPFSTDEQWTITASGIPVTGSQYTPGNFNIIWSSFRGDVQWTPQATAAYNNYFKVGKYGVYMKFNTNDPAEPGDMWRIRIPGPLPYLWDISSINLGNITVSTTSRVFCVNFHIIGGAVELSNVKFGLLDDGGMAEHNGVDTCFRWGTVGAGQEGTTTASGGGTKYVQFWDTVVKEDLITGSSYLYATDADLDEVATADDSKTIGVNIYDGLISDFIFNAIKLGADESGAKTATYRVYFDYA